MSRDTDCNLCVHRGCDPDGPYCAATISKVNIYGLSTESARRYGQDCGLEAKKFAPLNNDNLIKFGYRKAA